MGISLKGSKARPAQAVSPQSHSSSGSSEEVSDDELSEHQNGSRKRRRISPTSSQESHADATPNIPVSTVSRIKAKQSGSVPKASGEVDSVSTASVGQEKVSFASLGVEPWLVASLSSMGIKRPTGIQKASIPEILKGKDWYVPERFWNERC